MTGPGRYKSKSRTRGLVSMVCVAHTTAGQPCKRKAMVGTTVCYVHNGANGQVINAADRRLLLAQLMAREPDRHPWEIIVDATRRFDALAQVEEHMLLHGDLTPEQVVEQLDRYVRALENAHKTAVAAVTTKAVEQISLARSSELEDYVRTFYEAEGGPGPLLDAVAEALDRVGLTRPWRTYALELAAYKLTAEPNAPEPVRPVVPMLRPVIEGEVVTDDDDAATGTNPAARQDTSERLTPTDIAGPQEPPVDLEDADDELARLRAERERLRALARERGIDPDGDLSQAP